ncbi:hypothetical protein PspLS_07696 [Pyricularia sp. CBS 133598]|nr:hypothetical protein PspLS_07696 [Pyricularia sp. CBS 133598]
MSHVMAEAVVHGILFALDLGLGAMHIAEFTMGHGKHPEADHNHPTVRVYAGLDTDDLKDAGGSWPDVRVWNERGVFRGARCAERDWGGEAPDDYHLNSGDWADIKVGMTEGEGQPTYALLSGNKDALCVAYVTMTRPDGGKGSVLAGNWARACDTRQHNVSIHQTYPDNPSEIPWYYSNVVIDDNRDPLMCVWLGQSGDVSTTGMSMHFQDFAASTPHKGEEGIQFYCEGNPSLKFYNENPAQKAFVWEPEPYTPEPEPTPEYLFGDVAFNNVSRAHWEATLRGQPITYQPPPPSPLPPQGFGEVEEAGEEEESALETRSPTALSFSARLRSLRRWLTGRQEHGEGGHEEHGHGAPPKSPPNPQPIPPKMRRPSFMTKRAEKCEWAGFKNIPHQPYFGAGPPFAIVGPPSSEPDGGEMKKWEEAGRPRRRSLAATDTRIVFSNSTAQTATALCTGGSRGPKFVSWAEGKYCNPRTNEVLPLCGGGGVEEDCFDTDLLELRVRRSLVKRELLSDGHMEDDDMDHHLLLQWFEPGKQATTLLRPNREKRDAMAERKRAGVLAKRERGGLGRS